MARTLRLHKRKGGDESTTGMAEQRRTEWMPFKSLDSALMADNPSQTVEGHRLRSGRLCWLINPENSVRPLGRRLHRRMTKRVKRRTMHPELSSDSDTVAYPADRSAVINLPSGLRVSG